eukprot:c23705_g1_i1 orf=22-1545(-)
MPLQHISLTQSQAWRCATLLSLLACLCCCALTPATQAVPCAAEGCLANRRFLLSDGTEKDGDTGKLRLNLERLPESYKDGYEVLRAAIHRDRGRRGRLERRVLAGIDDNVVPNSASETNGSLANGGGLLEVSLDVISGSSVGSGEYFASVSIGTPPQKLFLIADTGSDLTWVKCLPSKRLTFVSRKGELATNQSFNEGASSSFAPVSCLSRQCSASFFPPICDGLSGHCKFSYSYTDQSFSTGSLAIESVTLGERRQANVLIGCGRQYAGPNFDKAGGVIGLGQGPLSLASQLAAQSAYSNKFSYCLADFFGPSSISGSLAFGDTLLQTTLKYTPLLQNPYVDTFYYVGVRTVKVGNITLDIPANVWEIDDQGNGGTIIDSGTTLAQFAKPAYDAIRDAFQEAISDPPMDKNSVEGLDLCYKTNTTSKSLSFPAFAIVFDGGLVMAPSQENYFTEVAPGITCLAMQEAPEASFSVVGNLLQQNYHIEFDRLHNRLGVAPADCSKLHS